MSCACAAKHSMYGWGERLWAGDEDVWAGDEDVWAGDEVCSDSISLMSWCNVGLLTEVTCHKVEVAPFAGLKPLYNSQNLQLFPLHDALVIHPHKPLQRSINGGPFHLLNAGLHRIHKPPPRRLHTLLDRFPAADCGASEPPGHNADTTSNAESSHSSRCCRSQSNCTDALQRCHDAEAATTAIGDGCRRHHRCGNAARHDARGRKSQRSGQERHARDTSTAPVKAPTSSPKTSCR